MPKTLYELEQWALAEFQSVFFEGSGVTDDDEATDLISEIADSRTPIYTHEVLEVAMSDLWLAFDPGGNILPDTSACQLIQAGIYYHVMEKLSDWYYKNKID